MGIARNRTPGQQQQGFVLAWVGARLRVRGLSGGGAT